VYFPCVQQLFYKTLRQIIYIVYYEHLLQIPYCCKKTIIIISIVYLIPESQDIRITHKTDTIKI